MPFKLFTDFTEITAKFDTPAAATSCGHAITKGDRIGYTRGAAPYCADCWRSWCAENAEAEQYESGLPS